MKKLFMGLALMVAGSLSATAQGVEGFIVEKFYVTNAADNAGSGVSGTPLPTGSVVWRFYVDMAAGWELQSVYGDPNHELRIETTTAFFNNIDRGEAFSHAINGNQMVNNTNYIDSYLSLGGTSSNRLGVLKSEDDNTNNIAFVGGYLQNNDASAGLPLTQRDGSFGVVGTPVSITPAGINVDIFGPGQTPVPGTVFSTTSGAWATTASCVGPTASNRVLIAQITSDGVLTYAFNVQVRNTTTFAVENYVPSNPQGAEIVLAQLAGVVNQANALPVVNITAPGNGTSYLVGQTVTIDATATDADGTITNVEFLVDGNVVGSDNTAPYTFDWTATNGNHSLTARATDNLNGIGTSPAVNISVGAVIPPTVSITSPAGGATFVEGDVVTINANATDNGFVTGVEFFVNAVSIGTDVTAPYSITWNSVQGAAVLTAVATDNDNASTTSAAVNISVFDSSAAYVIVSEVAACSASNFCLPIQAVTPVNDVIGYDIILAYDNSKVVPTGVVTIDTALINPGFTSTANSIDNANGLMYISVFFNASAPIQAEFEGVGRLLCVEFAKTAGFNAADTADFSVTSLQESYINGVQPKVVSPGDYSTFQETEFVSSLKFWADNSPIRYNSGNPSQYLITNIYGDNGTCTSISGPATAIQPDVNGEFTYDIANGASVNIQKDILNTTSVQPVVNGFDAFLTRRVLINDGSFQPSVYQIIAMDVNTDGVVSAGDLSQINQRAVLVIGEFRQDWNYSAQGVSNGQPSKDWLFVDGNTLTSNPAYQISANYPFPDGVGYSKSNVPDVTFCSPVPVQSSGACQTFEVETYTGILVGDVNGNYATVNPSSAFRSASDKIIFDLTKAVVENGYAQVPVFVSTIESVNSLDFAMNFNQSKLSFDNVAVATESVEALSYVNADDNKLRFTSFSLNNYILDGAVAYVRFAVDADQIDAADISEVEAYLNGEAVTAEVIGSRAGIAEVMVDVFPNPAGNVVNMIVSENSSVELMDLSGKVIMAESVVNAYQQYSINTQSIANGVYVLKVNSGSKVTMKKVVVQK